MSKNKDDPAARIVDLFNPNGDMARLPYIETATVIAPPPEMVVQLRDIQYKKERIKINEYYTKGHEREIEIPTAPMSGSDSRGDGHVAGGFIRAKIIFKDDLKPGDKVATVQSRDKQTLYVLYRIKEWS